MINKFRSWMMAAALLASFSCTTYAVDEPVKDSFYNRLNALRALRDNGTITHEEHDRRRQEIIIEMSKGNAKVEKSAEAKEGIEQSAEISSNTMSASTKNNGVVEEVPVQRMPGNQGLYLFGAIGRDTVNKSDFDNMLTSVGGVGFSSSVTTPIVYRLGAGYQINKNFAVEGGYINDDTEYTAMGGNLAGPFSVSARIDGWDLKAVGILPFNDQFSLLGKLGVAKMTTSIGFAGPGGSISFDGSKTSATYGIGAKYNFSNNISVRFDIDSYEAGIFNVSDRGTLWTLGVACYFF